MTSHETALEAAAHAYAVATGYYVPFHAGLSSDSANSIRKGVSSAISAYISTLSPDVSGLVDRLRKALEPFAKYSGDRRHLKQRFFLQLLVCPEGDDHPENYGPHFDRARDAIDALSSLSLQLAATERERDDIADKCDNALENLDGMRTRAETAEASLSAALAENERLRKALADMLPPKLDWREADADGYYVHHKASAIRDARAALSTPSKEDKK